MVPNGLFDLIAQAFSNAKLAEDLAARGRLYRPLEERTVARFSLDETSRQRAERTRRSRRLHRFFMRWAQIHMPERVV